MNKKNWLLKKVPLKGVLNGRNCKIVKCTTHTASANTHVTQVSQQTTRETF
jgi:hypothetical protein